MKNHEMTLVVRGNLYLVCECGYEKELEPVCTTKRVAYLTEAHKADVLIECMGILGVTTKD